MKAVFFEKPGGLDVLKYGEFPTPKPQAGEALVKVRACGLNHLDIWLRSGSQTVPLPHIVGSDVSSNIGRALEEIEKLRVELKGQMMTHKELLDLMKEKGIHSKYYRYKKYENNCVACKALGIK